MYKILSIDAWAEGEDSWTWNAWYEIGKIDVDLNSSPETILQNLAEEGFIRNPHLGDVEDDQYNLMIVDKETREPI